MIHGIINSLLPTIENLNFADRVAGISYVLELSELTTDNKTILKRIPAVQNYNKNQCEKNDYIDLEDNNKKKYLKLPLAYNQSYHKILQEF